MIVSGAAPPRVDTLRRVRRCNMRVNIRYKIYRHGRNALLRDPAWHVHKREQMPYLLYARERPRAKPKTTFEACHAGLRGSASLSWRYAHGRCMSRPVFRRFCHARSRVPMYLALSIIAPSVNVLRRTRRKPSTIRGAAPEVVIGQSTAARAGARPYHSGRNRFARLLVLTQIGGPPDVIFAG